MRGCTNWQVINLIKLDICEIEYRLPGFPPMITGRN